MQNEALTSIFALIFLLSIVCLIVGLIKPALFSRVSGNAIPKRKTIALAAFGAILVSFMGVGIFAPAAEVKDVPLPIVNVQLPVEDKANEVAADQGGGESNKSETAVIPDSEVKNDLIQPRAEEIAKPETTIPSAEEPTQEIPKTETLSPEIPVSANPTAPLVAGVTT